MASEIDVRRLPYALLSPTSWNARVLGVVGLGLAEITLRPRSSPG